MQKRVLLFFIIFLIFLPNITESCRTAYGIISCGMFGCSCDWAVGDCSASYCASQWTLFDEGICAVKGPAADGCSLLDGGAIYGDDYARGGWKCPTGLPASYEGATCFILSGSTCGWSSGNQYWDADDSRCIGCDLTNHIANKECGNANNVIWDCTLALSQDSTTCEQACGADANCDERSQNSYYCSGSNRRYCSSSCADSSIENCDSNDGYWDTRCDGTGATGWSCSADNCERCKTQYYRDYSCSGGSCICSDTGTRNYCENAPSSQHCSSGSWTSSGYCGSGSVYCSSNRYRYIDRYECDGSGNCNSYDYTSTLTDCGATSYSCPNSCTRRYTYTCSAGTCGTYNSDTYCTAGSQYCSAGSCIVGTCNAAYACSPGSGNNNYGAGGIYRCQGYCDGSGNCDYAGNCENCNNYDAWACAGTNRCGSALGDNREYWDYSCSSGACTYSVTSSTNCACNAAETDGGQVYTTQGTCTDYTGCDSASCQSSSPQSDVCLSGTTLREYYVSGSGDSATCISIDYDCTNSGPKYICSNGICIEDQCDSNADCNDNNLCTNDWCENPALDNSVCHNDALAAGTDCAGPGEYCKICDNSGNCNQMPTDDPDCGTIDCSSWYVQTGIESPTDTENCYNKQDITTNRCEAVGDCKDANTADCGTQSNDVLQYSCGICKYIAASSCFGTILGTCTNYGTTSQCDPTWKCSIQGNNNYGIGGVYNCQGYCDGSGSCDYAGNCACSQGCGAVCDVDSDCPCPSDGCIDADLDSLIDDFRDYPDDGTCTATCTCNTGTGSGQPCQPTITYNDASNCGVVFRIWIDESRLMTIGKEEFIYIYVHNLGAKADSYKITSSKEIYDLNLNLAPQLVIVSLTSDRIHTVEPNKIGNTFAIVTVLGPISSGKISFNVTSENNPSAYMTGFINITAGGIISLPEFELTGLLGMLLLVFLVLIISYSSHFSKSFFNRR